MNTDTVVTMHQVVPQRADSAVASPAAVPARPVGEVTPAIPGRQEVAVNGKDSPEAASKSPANSDKLDSALKEINSYVQQVNRRIQFSPHDDLPLGRTVIKVVDADTEKVIREIPSEEILAMAQRISELYGENDNVEGLIITDRA